MTDEELYDHPGWRWCTAEGAREHVLLLGLQTSFREKLEWLEEAETLALRMQANSKPLHADCLSVPNPPPSISL